MDRPKEIRRVDGYLRIQWASNRLMQIPFDWIRKNCACAVCLELKVPLSADQPFYPRAIRAQKIDSVGNYAIQILWEDGHRSIVSFDRFNEYQEQGAA